MKLSLSVRVAEPPKQKDVTALPFDVLAAKAKSAGFAGLSMRASVVSVESPPERVRAVRRTLDETGLAASMVCGDIPLAANNAAATQALRDIAPYLDLAQALGSTLVRVMMHGAEDIPFAQHCAANLGKVLSHIDSDRLAAGDAGLAHPARDDCRMRRLAAARGEDRLCGEKAVDVLGLGFFAHQYHLLSDLAALIAGRGNEPPPPSHAATSVHPKRPLGRAPSTALPNCHAFVTTRTLRPCTSSRALDMVFAPHVERRGEPCIAQASSCRAMARPSRQDGRTAGCRSSRRAHPE